MKKYLYIAIAAATLASCSQDEVMEVAEKEAITFGNVFVGKSTRAAEDPSYSNKDNVIKSFQLFGTVNNVNIYNDVTVSNTNYSDADKNYGYGEIWSCPVTQYWIPGASYKFVAIVDGKKSGVTSTTIVDGMPTSITYNADGSTDLLCQTISLPNNTTYETVGFNFNHLLSKAKFTVTNTTPEATMFKHVITDIKISNAYASNTYDVVNETWGTGTTGDGQTFDAITATGATTECANEKLLIPGLTEAKVEFKVNLYYVEKDKEDQLVSTTDYTGNKALKATITDGMKANYSYNFTFNVGVGKEITFTVSELPEWTNSDPQNVTVQ